MGKFDLHLDIHLSEGFGTEACTRQLGCNWQRKVWYLNPYYWRALYDDDNDRLAFEYIHEDNLAGDNWAENANARISCAGWGLPKADFSVRPPGDGRVATIVYSDGTRIYVAESDVATATGWAWQTITEIFDGTGDGGHYTKPNLACNRDTNGPWFWMSAVFDDGTNIWVKARQETIGGGGIGAWDVAVNVSDATNTDAIYGQSVRSIAEAGVGKKDMIFIFKQGAGLHSRYFDSPGWEDIQTIDAAVTIGIGAFDLEHGINAGEKEAHVLYVDGDGTVAFSKRASGNNAASSWSASVAVTSVTTGHHCTAIVESEDGRLSVIWRTSTLVKYRTYTCATGIWFPLLVNDPSSWDPSTDAVVGTTTIYQMQSPDDVGDADAIILIWIGCAASDPCTIGWGTFEERSISSESSESSVSSGSSESSSETKSSLSSDSSSETKSSLSSGSSESSSETKSSLSSESSSETKSSQSSGSSGSSESVEA